MASPELAEKLKKRLDGTDQEPETNPHQAPPPAPVIPQKVCVFKIPREKSLK